MKLPKNYFENLSAAKYRDYLKLLPSMKEENTRIITTLILTFVAMSFFGIFAINPTLSTIITLRKQLEDSKQVHEKLTTKISNLSIIYQQYNQLTSDISFVLEAIPQSPKPTELMAQINTLSKQNNIKISSIDTLNIDLIGGKTIEDSACPMCKQVGFSVSAQGEYQNLINFSKSLAKINRLVSIDSISITKDSEANILILDMRGRGYFKQ